MTTSKGMAAARMSPPSGRTVWSTNRWSARARRRACRRSSSSASAVGPAGDVPQDVGRTPSTVTVSVDQPADRVGQLLPPVAAPRLGPAAQAIAGQPAEPFEVGGVAVEDGQHLVGARPRGPAAPPRRRPGPGSGRAWPRWARCRTGPPGSGPGRGPPPPRPGGAGAGPRPGRRRRPASIRRRTRRWPRTPAGWPPLRPASVTRGCWTGLGQLKHGSSDTCSPWNSASSCDHSACMHSTCSRATSRRAPNSTPWSAASARFHPKPIPSTTRPPLRWSSVATCLASTIGSCWATRVTPVPRRDPLGHRRRRGQGHERVEAAPVVVEADPLDQRRRRRRPHRKMGVLGEVEGVEPALLGGPGQLGRWHGQIGEEGGDPDPHGGQPSSPAVRPAPGLVAGSANRVAKAASSRARAPAIAGAPVGHHQPLDPSGGLGGERGDAAGQLHRLVQHRSRGGDPEGEPGPDRLVGVDPLGGQQDQGRPLPTHPFGEEPAAARLGRHPHLGERGPQPGIRVDHDQVDVAEQGAAESHGGTVDGGQQRLVERHDHVQQVPEPGTGLRSSRPGGDGRHLAQVLARGEGGPPPGQDHRPDPVVLEGTDQRSGDRPVHGGVEGVAHLRSVEGDQPHAVAVDPVDAVPGVGAGPGHGSPAAGRSAMTFSAASLTPVDRGHPT